MIEEYRNALETDLQSGTARAHLKHEAPEAFISESKRQDGPGWSRTQGVSEPFPSESFDGIRERRPIRCGISRGLER